MRDGNGFLSSTGRGGDRVLFALTAQDVGFYLETNGMVWATEATPHAVQAVSFRRVSSRAVNS